MSEPVSLFAPVQPCIDERGHAWETSHPATPPASSHGASWAVRLACRRCGERLQYAPVAARKAGARA